MVKAQTQAICLCAAHASQTWSSALQTTVDERHLRRIFTSACTFKASHALSERVSLDQHEPLMMRVPIFECLPSENFSKKFSARCFRFRKFVCHARNAFGVQTLSPKSVLNKKLVGSESLPVIRLDLLPREPSPLELFSLNCFPWNVFPWNPNHWIQPNRLSLQVERRSVCISKPIKATINHKLCSLV